MRTRMMILTGALLVTSASYAQAQDATAAPAPAQQAASFLIGDGWDPEPNDEQG